MARIGSCGARGRYSRRPLLELCCSTRGGRMRSSNAVASGPCLRRPRARQPGVPWHALLSAHKALSECTSVHSATGKYIQSLCRLKCLWLIVFCRFRAGGVHGAPPATWQCSSIGIEKKNNRSDITPDPDGHRPQRPYAQGRTRAKQDQVRASAPGQSQTRSAGGATMHARRTRQAGESVTT